MQNFTYNKIHFFCFFILLFFVTLETKAQFPFSESFKNSTASNIQFGGSPVAFLTGGAGLKDGYNDLEGDGYLRLTNKGTEQRGIIWSDLYAFPSAYGMTISFEYYTHGGNGADGIAFILFDATASSVTPGAFGGSLGYAQKTSINGFSKGYLGVGIDEYGGFASSEEGRSGGLQNGLSSNITLRGQGTGTTGYPYLTSVQTTASPYLFNVAGYDRTATDNTKSGFRKIEIVLRPRPSNGGFFIDVNLIHGNVKTLIINNYEYTTPAPPNLKFAISSSTGRINNFHEIRNLSLSVDLNTLLEPVATPKSLSGCAGFSATSTDINIGNNGSVNTLAKINRESVDLDLDTPGIQSSKTVPGKGTFTYNSTTGQVTFTPQDNTIEGTVTINYTFNDTYGKPSNVSTITYQSSQPNTVNYTCLPYLKTEVVSLTKSICNIPNEIVSYEIKITNSGDGKATDVSLYFLLPDGINFESATASYTGNASGPSGNIPNTGRRTDSPRIGNFNIPINETVTILLKGKLTSQTRPGINSVDALAIYSDPAQLDRRVTPFINAFAEITTYATGGNVIGINFDGALSTEDDLLIINKPATVTTKKDICFGESFVWSVDGKTYNTSGTYTKTNDGCTADQTLELSIGTKPATVTTTKNICFGESFVWDVDGKTYTASGTYSKFNNGCTADQELKLTVGEKPQTITTTENICFGESFVWDANGQTYNSSGTYRKTNDGCTGDQILNLTVNPKTTDIVTKGVTICKGGTGLLSASSVTGIVPTPVTVFSGHWDVATDPISLMPNRRTDNIPICDFDPTPKGSYTTISFSVNVSGTYSLEMTGTNRYLRAGYIYKGDYTLGTCPGDGTWITGDDDYGIINTKIPKLTAYLEVGTLYTLVSLINAKWETPDYTADYIWTLTPPEGGGFFLDPLNLWYTSPTGGKPIGWGPYLNPVEASGSGMLNTNIPGSTTYYAGSTNPCSARVPAIFTIKEESTIAEASSKPTLCVNTLLTNITHITSGITGIESSTNLPTGVTATFSNNKITISGVPTVSGVFNYNISLIKDDNYCGQNTATGTITVNPKPTTVITKKDICFGESFVWDVDGKNYSVSGTFTKENDGCTADQELKLTVGEKPQTITTTENICFGESFVWDADGKTYTASGNYIVNNNGCNADRILKLNVAQLLDASIAEGSLIPEFCSGDNDGSFKIEITGGMMPYSVSLDRKNGTYTPINSNEYTFIDLSGGRHNVYIKDALDCTAELEVYIPNGITINPVANVSYSCLNDLPVNSVTITVDSSITDLEDLDYSLDGIIYQSENTFVNVPAGKQSIKVRHTNGCIQSTKDFIIDYIDPLTLTVDHGELNEILATTAGGNGQYRYSFNNEAFSTTNKFIIYKSGDYTVTVTDQNGCTTTTSKYFEYIDVCIPNHFTPNGDGINDEWGPGCTTQYKNLTFTVFDRYGRIIGNYKYGQTWDGKYNGTELSSGDYWYVLKLNDNKDNREFVGHFTLYR